MISPQSKPKLIIVKYFNNNIIYKYDSLQCIKNKTNIEIITITGYYNIPEWLFHKNIKKIIINHI